MKAILNRMDTQKEYAIMLADLVRVCEKCETAYMNAARKEDNDELEVLYRHYAAEMVKFSAELETEILRLGGNIEELKRSENHAQDLFELDVEEQEKKALFYYNEALDIDWPGSINETLGRQFTLIEEAREHIAAIKSSLDTADDSEIIEVKGQLEDEDEESPGASISADTGGAD